MNKQKCVQLCRTPWVEFEMALEIKASRRLGVSPQRGKEAVGFTRGDPDDGLTHSHVCSALEGLRVKLVSERGWESSGGAYLINNTKVAQRLAQPLRKKNKPRKCSLFLEVPKRCHRLRVMVDSIPHHIPGYLRVKKKMRREKENALRKSFTLKIYNHISYDLLSSMCKFSKSAGG